jgi:hypothetical protein
MVWVTKLKISIHGIEQTFEKGKDQVQSINIDEDKGLIIIEFEKGSKWDYKSIPIRMVEIMYYNIETFEDKLSHRETYRRTC